MTKVAKQRHTRYNLQGDFEKIKAALADTTHDVKGKAVQIMSDSYDGLKVKSAEMQGNVENYINEKPLKSVGIALVSGLILGLWLKR